MNHIASTSWGTPQSLRLSDDWARQAPAMPPWRGTDPRSRWEVLDTLTAVALEQLVGCALVVFSDKWSMNGYFNGETF